MEKPDVEKQPEINKQIIDTVLQKGVDFSITVKHPNLLHKLKILPKSMDVLIPPMVLGTILRITKVLQDIRFEIKPDEKDFIKEGIDLISKNGRDVIKIIAMAIQNNDKNPSPKLMYFIRKNLNASEMLKLLQVVLAQLWVQDFLALTASMQGMNLLETASTPGESSEESSNTSDSQESKSSGKSAGQT